MITLEVENTTYGKKGMKNCFSSSHSIFPFMRSLMSITAEKRKQVVPDDKFKENALKEFLNSFHSGMTDPVNFFAYTTLNTQYKRCEVMWPYF